ncbi:MAG: 50S ribosomal protein L29 [Candidatus Diapherotrites archaeon]|nr:50S ribosomal protein L29 [Candidatus Diapherotrites archaeon]
MTKKHGELFKMNERELNTRAIELKQDLAKERAAIASGTRSEKPAKIRNLRREIARVLTALSMKNRVIGKKGNKLKNNTEKVKEQLVNKKEARN